MRLFLLSLPVVVVVLASSCGLTPARCDPRSCAGCCDDKGQCATGNTLASCGSAGTSCQTCRSSESCTLGQCLLSTGTGGSTGGGGGATGGGGGGSSGQDAGTDGGIYDVQPRTLTFSACPTRDPQGAPVPDVWPHVQTVTITNTSGAAAALGVTLLGNDAGAFSLPNAVPSTTGPMTSTAVSVAFAPAAAGTWGSALRVGVPGGPSTTVPILGETKNLPLIPTIETGPQRQDKSGFLTCTSESPLSDCTLRFPDTLMNQVGTLQLKIRNRGCPALKIVGLQLDGTTTPGTTDGFSIDSPSVLPSTGAPLVLSTAIGTDETTVTLGFAATDDGSGAGAQSHYAVLSIRSNDPLVGNGAANPARLSLEATAIRPSVLVTPLSCNFTNPQDTCGNATRIATRSSFRVTNDGSTPIVISAVRFRSSGGTSSSNQRFSVTTNIQGQTLLPTASASLVVTEAAQPLLVSDQLEIVADVPGLGAGSAGTVLVAVMSGLKPCLTTNPPDTIDFGDPQVPLTTRSVTILNGAGCGTLVIDSVAASGGQTFFSLVAPFVMPGTTVLAGGSTQAPVQYQRPTSGGLQRADLRIATNDPDYGAPQHKVLLLQSAAAVDPIPTARISACTPAQLVNDPNCVMGARLSAAFSLSTINPDELTLSGVNSTDNTAVRDYRFTLLPPLPGGATTAALANHGLTTTANRARLTIPAGATGTYRVGLEVWDDRGQKSASSDVITLSVQP